MQSMESRIFLQNAHICYHYYLCRNMLLYRKQFIADKLATIEHYTRKLQHILIFSSKKKKQLQALFQCKDWFIAMPGEIQFSFSSVNCSCGGRETH